jgi:hypothetical protein
MIHFKLPLWNNDLGTYMIVLCPASQLKAGPFATDYWSGIALVRRSAKFMILDLHERRCSLPEMLQFRYLKYENVTVSY